MFSLEVKQFPQNVLKQYLNSRSYVEMQDFKGPIPDHVVWKALYL